MRDTDLIHIESCAKEIILQLHEQRILIQAVEQIINKSNGEGDISNS